MNKNFKYAVRIYLSAKEIMQKDYVILDEIQSELFGNDYFLQGFLETLKEATAVSEGVWNTLEDYILEKTDKFTEKYVVVTDGYAFNHEEDIDDFIAIDVIIDIQVDKLLKDYQTKMMATKRLMYQAVRGE